MRLDPDACWISSNSDVIVPSLPPNKLYHAHHFYTENEQYCQGLPQFSMDYVQKQKVDVANKKLWKDHILARQKNPKCEGFYNNFEVSSVDFMRRRDVVAWHHELTEHEPFGVLRWHWDDSILRLVTMAIFANPETVMFTEGTRGKSAGYQRPCKDGLQKEASSAPKKTEKNNNQSTPKRGNKQKPGSVVK